MNYKSAVLVGININSSEYDFKNSMQELKGLSISLGIEKFHYITQNRDKYDSQFLIGSGKVKEIANLRVELEQIIDMMDNFEKYKGNWYLARLYYLANNAFQINRWKNLLEKRINKVNDLYNLVNSEINRKRMLFLNILMLLLFVLWFLGV